LKSSGHPARGDSLKDYPTPAYNKVGQASTTYDNGMESDEAAWCCLRSYHFEKGQLNKLRKVTHIHIHFLHLFYTLTSFVHYFFLITVCSDANVSMDMLHYLFIRNASYNTCRAK